MTDREEQQAAPAAAGPEKDATTEEQKAAEKPQVKYSMSPSCLVPLDQCRSGLLRTKYSALSPITN